MIRQKVTHESHETSYSASDCKGIIQLTFRLIDGV